MFLLGGICVLRNNAYLTIYDDENELMLTKKYSYEN